MAIATAKALIERSDEQHLKVLDLELSSWAKSLFQRMGFVNRACTTSKPEVPELAKKEAGLILQHQIVDLIEKYQIPPSMVINIDQTPLKYAPVTNQTLVTKGSKHVVITGSSHRQAITATFGVTYENGFHPMQLIYGGKTVQSLLRFKFPESFSLSANPKHYSNTKESLKLLEEVIISYVVSERERLLLEKDHAALLLMDVFRGQMTRPVLQKLEEHRIFIVRVPPNMTNLFQPLDLTVNGAAKAFMKRKYTEWYSGEIANALDSCKELHDIDIQLKLSILKPLDAKWVLERYNYLTSEKGRDVIANGWKAAGITNAITLGSSLLENLDPFAELDPLETSVVLSAPNFYNANSVASKGELDAL